MTDMMNAPDYLRPVFDGSDPASVPKRDEAYRVAHSSLTP